MKNKSMLEVAEEYLRLNKETTFNQLWNEISKELKSLWKTQNKVLSVPELEYIKKGEFYKLLTLDGKFLRLRNGKWVLIEDYSFDDAMKLKAFYKDNAKNDENK